MNMSLIKLRLAKLWTSATRPTYWNALLSGVAPAIEHRAILRRLKVDGVLDVGANRGQFTLACRFALPGVPVVAFEPIPKEAEVFRRVHAGMPWVQLIESALGETTKRAILHLSQKADSSSLLPIGAKQTELFKDTVEVGTIDVPVTRMDDLASLWYGRNEQLLKLDVQGYELSVLRGATETLKSCAFVYAECSEIALYDGQALRADVEKFLQEHGFTMQRRHNEQWAQGQLIQADYLFSRAQKK
jgi:FkbM family methyltransferase